MFKNASREEVDEAIARCFYACGLLFLVLARCPYFQDMVSAIASFGKGYKAPNYEKIRTTLLNKEKGKFGGQLYGTESSWEHFGCSIVSYGGTDTTKRPLINFMVSSAGGIVFKKSIDTSGSSKAGEFIAGALLDIIREVGEENVVQAIIDSAADCKLAGHLVEKVFPNIFWTPCATHCLNLLLKDLDLIKWMGKAIKEVEKYVKVLWPVMAILRVVDRDELIMGVMYEAIDQMLEKIKEILKEDKDGTLTYEEICELAQERWDMLHSPLHATAILLNPLFAKKPYKDKEVMKG
ncbi:hypothetical protein L7F22_013409 [Adiantum nelumboides]|nr:hypothetical protein [Adiantum nelumboides]